MDYYVATGINADDKLVQVCVQVDPSDVSFHAPIKCCAKHQDFWRDKLNAYKMKHMTSVKKIHGLVL